MANDSVGQIGLDLVVNDKGFKKQMTGVQNMAKKAALALAAAFSVKKIIDFGASCIELGSDLQEVQNVVDVSFPAMSKQVDAFAQNAAASFGLSETMAKRFTGTFGAMAKAFGFSEKQAYEMSTALTGLAGDVASFYNITQDEAYTKLKSVFTGETESLKDLGVVMTQAALDQYALANGIGKTTAQMTEAEKVALRYKFVQEQLTAASGDFIRTSDSWANQVRILQLQFDSFKASIGQGLINVLTPVIKTINLLMQKLVALGNMFKSFTEMIMGGGGGSGTAAAETAAGMEAAAASSENMASGVDSANSSAKKLKKTLSTLAVDSLNILNSNSDDSSSSGGSGGAGAGISNLGIDKTTNDTNALSESVSTLEKCINSLANAFKNGFKQGLGDDFENSLLRIKGHVSNIGASLKEIFTDKTVATSACKMALKISESFGKTVGSFVSIGATIAENIVGGADKYLQQDGGYIKERLAGIFDATGETAEIVGNLSATIAEIFEVFRGEDAKQCTADLIGIVANAGLGMTQLATQIGRDVVGCIAKPIEDNKDKIKKAIENTLGPISTILSSANNSIQTTFNKIFKVYDSKVKPAFEDISEGISSVWSTILDNYNEYIAPVVDKLSTEFAAVWESDVQPALDSAIDFFGEVASLIGVVWKEYLSPFVSWIVDTIVPVVAPVLELFGKIFINVFGSIAKFVGGCFKSASETISNVTELLKGGKEAIAKTWESIKSKASESWEKIKGTITEKVGKIKSGITEKFNSIKEKIVEKWNNIKSDAATKWEEIKSKIAGKIETLKTKISEKFEKIKSSVVEIFKKMWEKIKEPINSILGGVEKMANGVVSAINAMIKGLNKLKFDIPDWIGGEFGGKTFGLNIPTISKVSIPKLAQGGYVKANTPQLAMIGDNRHQGEVVAPEDKLYEIAYKAMTDALEKLVSMMAGQKTQYADAGDIIIPVYLNSTKLEEFIITAQQRRKFRSGGK